MVKDYFYYAYLVDHVYAVVLQASNVTLPGPRTIRPDDEMLPPPKPMIKASPGSRRRFQSIGESPGCKTSKQKHSRNISKKTKEKGLHRRAGICLLFLYQGCHNFCNNLLFRNLLFRTFLQMNLI
jgi:hypothetical protein